MIEISDIIFPLLAGAWHLSFASWGPQFSLQGRGRFFLESSNAMRYIDLQIRTTTEIPNLRQIDSKDHYSMRFRCVFSGLVLGLTILALPGLAASQEAQIPVQEQGPVQGPFQGPAPEKVQTPVPAKSRSQLAFEKAEKDFRAYRSKILKTISHKSHAPVLLSQGRKTEYAVIVIHGLYESPRSIMGIAKEFEKNGMNVYLPLLPGHWLRKYKRADDVTYAQWLKEIDQSIQFAKLLGKKVLIAGFSLGGLLATYGALQFPTDIHGLFVWSPAYGLSGRVNLAASFGTILGYDANEWEDSPVDGKNVPYFSLQMASQIPLLHKYINKKVLKGQLKSNNPNPNLLYVWDMAPKISVPTFVAYSEDDEAISQFQVRKFYNYLSVQKFLLRFENIKHTPTPKSQSDANPLRPWEYNAKFDVMAEYLQRFLRAYFLRR